MHLFAVASDLALRDPAEMSAQKAWLQSALAASTAPWQVVTFHHPPFSSGDDHSSTVAMHWPFAEWGADLVLSAHEHTYERVAANGITYLVDGLGGASRDNFGTPVTGSVGRYSANWGAVRIRASESTPQGELLSIDSGGTVQDQFSIAAAQPEVTVVLRDGVSPSAGYCGNAGRDHRAVLADGGSRSLAVAARGRGRPERQRRRPGHAGPLGRLPISAGSTVVSASLTLQLFNGTNSSYGLYEVLRDSVETEVTWNRASNAAAWALSGAAHASDRGQTRLGTFGPAAIERRASP